MSETTTHDVWGFRTPPSWALRALEKGIIDVNRFEALVRLAAEDPDAATRSALRRSTSCSCRRRPRRACTTWRV